VRIAIHHCIDQSPIASIIDHHELPVAAGLGKHVLHRPVEHRCTVAGTHHDRYSWFGSRGHSQPEACDLGQHVRAESRIGVHGVEHFRKGVPLG